MKRFLCFLLAAVSTMLLRVAKAEERSVFQTDQIYESETEGTIHYNLFVPEDYDSNKPYALHIALPGWEGLYFQGVGEDLRWEYLPFESPNYVSDMIVVSAQLNDWGQTSARQAVALTEHMMSEYNIDPDRVYITGYSGGGETLSRVMELKPELYTAALFVSSQWDGDPAPLIKSRIPLYLFTAEHPLDLHNGIPIGCADLVSGNTLFGYFLDNGPVLVRCRVFPASQPLHGNVIMIHLAQRGYTIQTSDPSAWADSAHCNCPDFVSCPGLTCKCSIVCTLDMLIVTSV